LTVASRVCRCAALGDVVLAALGIDHAQNGIVPEQSANRRQGVLEDLVEERLGPFVLRVVEDFVGRS
jgi:hypothetical protein